MSFSSFIKDTLPFGVLKSFAKKRYPLTQVIHYTPGLPDIPNEDSRFNSIVSVQGLGFSGSGAVVDYLREYSSCLVMGTIDVDGSTTKGNRHLNGEINILRYAGGLFEMEYYLADNNLFLKDALIKRFIRLVNGEEMFKSAEAKLLLNRFYNQLIDFEIDTGGRNDYNSHLINPLCPNSNIKVIRPFTTEEYRGLCRRFLTSLFNLYYNGTAKHLVLDQLCGDFNYDLDRYAQYIPNLRIIMVFRDPRDTYTYALRKNVPWIPHDSVQHFIKWYKISTSRVKAESEYYLPIRFEDLVLDYDKCSQKIIAFLGLDEKEHSCPKSCFVPEVSARNIAIWKEWGEHRNEMEMIREELKGYCYEE